MSSSTRRLFTSKQFGWRWLVALAFPVAVYVANLLLDNWLTSVALPTVWNGIVYLAGLPMGFGLLTVGVVLLLAIGAAVVEQSQVVTATVARIRSRGKNPVAPVEVVRVLSVEERHEIQQAREMWLLGGELATGYLGVSLVSAQRLLNPTIPLTRLLWYPTNDLSASRGRLSDALHQHGNVPLERIIAHLQDVFPAYMMCIRWLHVVDEIGIPQDPGFVEQRALWEEHHTNFIDGMTRLTLRPDFSSMKRAFDREKSKDRIDSSITTG